MAYRILIFSSSRSEREAMAAVVSRAGHIPDVVVSIEQAMEIGNQSKYDLAVIDADFTSPGQGWQLAKQFRHSDWGSNLGIIMLTRSSPYGFMRDEEFARVYDQVLFFPISNKELLGNIERVIKSVKK